MKTFFTSESVTCGHPDKVCDRIADAILDAILAQDKNARVACEVVACPNRLHIIGEITTTAKVNYKNIARDVIKEIGYTETGHDFDAETVKIDLDVHEQSPDIAMGVNHKESLDTGAGDQGMMFGYACNESSDYMPLTIALAHKLAKQLEKVRRDKSIPYLLPDGKVQVTVEYDDGKPTRVDAVVVSSQHQASANIETLRKDILEKVIKVAIPSKYLDDKTTCYINPTGRFVIGGPAGDSGLTGRKIIVDTYGGVGRHGGGSFSGKDPTKVDKSAEYLARYIAKNIVAANLADKCEVQISYAIGMAKPTSVFIETFGTEKIPTELIYNQVMNDIDMRPRAIINKFHLDSPIYKSICCYGHFGDNAKDQLWEQTDMAEKWAKLLK